VRGGLLQPADFAMTLHSWWVPYVKHVLTHHCMPMHCHAPHHLQFGPAFDPEGLRSSRGQQQPFADAVGLKASPVPVFLIIGDRDNISPPQVCVCTVLSPADVALTYRPLGA
jgi:hypothetical protein